MDVHVTSLPMPEIDDIEMFENSSKLSHRRDISKVKPPKLKPRHLKTSPFNATPHAISFRSDCDAHSNSDAFTLSSSYDESAEGSYFEQCFIKLEKLGEGSFGEVFKVQSKQDGGLYAVKMCYKILRKGCLRRERLEEVRRYEEFAGHPHIVKFYKAWEQSDFLYMQMELCRESLEDYLVREKHIPEERVWEIMLDLLLALKTLHDRNLIHLDIKLDNILLTDDNTCKLGDFGLVIHEDEAKKDTTEGDSRYIAPELLQSQFTKAADVFSLGIAMLELSCFLELPPNGPIWRDLRKGIAPATFIKPISLELQSVITAMMSPNPKARPTVNELLDHDKFAGMLLKRGRCIILKKIRNNLRNLRRLAFAKGRVVRIVISNYFEPVVSAIKRGLGFFKRKLWWRKALAQIRWPHPGNKTEIPILRTPNHTPNHMPFSNIINSTPLHSNDDSEKDLPSHFFPALLPIETAMDRNRMDDDMPPHHRSLFAFADELKNEFSPVPKRRSLNVSSFKRTKLFKDDVALEKSCSSTSDSEEM